MLSWFSFRKYKINMNEEDKKDKTNKQKTEKERKKPEEEEDKRQGEKQFFLCFVLVSRNVKPCLESHLYSRPDGPSPFCQTCQSFLSRKSFAFLSNLVLKVTCLLALQCQTLSWNPFSSSSPSCPEKSNHAVLNVKLCDLCATSHNGLAVAGFLRSSGRLHVTWACLPRLGDLLQRPLSRNQSFWNHRPSPWNRH